MGNRARPGTVRTLSALCIAMLATAGCASIVGGMDQRVSVETRSADGAMIAGADCKLENSKGTWYTTTPGQVMIHRAYGDLHVSCSKAGQSVGDATASSSARGWIFGNIVFGGLIGVGVDMGTGAGFDYPTGIKVGSRNTIAAFADKATTTPVPLASPIVTSTAMGEADAKNGTGIELPAVHRDVSGDAFTMVAAHADQDRMCNASGPSPSVQVLDTSSHGRLEIRQGEFDAPGAKAAELCTNGKIYGTQIYYQPNAGFHGTDHVRYTVLAATGRFTRVVDIEVH